MFDANPAFIWQRYDRPRFRRNAERLLAPLADARATYGRQIPAIELTPAMIVGWSGRNVDGIEQLVAWINEQREAEPLLRAATAHLWCVMLFGDSTVAHALTDYMLRVQVSGVGYERALQSTQRSDHDITDWLLWFVARFAESMASPADLTERQRIVLREVSGKTELTTKVWARIGGCSVPTAQRDINELLSRNLLRRNPGGSKRTTYAIAVSSL